MSFDPARMRKAVNDNASYGSGGYNMHDLQKFYRELTDNPPPKGRASLVAALKTLNLKQQSPKRHKIQLRLPSSSQQQQQEQRPGPLRRSHVLRDRISMLTSALDTCKGDLRVSQEQIEKLRNDLSAAQQELRLSFPSLPPTPTVTPLKPIATIPTAPKPIAPKPIVSIPVSPQLKSSLLKSIQMGKTLRKVPPTKPRKSFTNDPLLEALNRSMQNRRRVMKQQQQQQQQQEQQQWK